MNPAIAISAFNRPAALQRLLADLCRGEYPVDDVPLIISIDKGDDESNRAVRQVAAAFHWPFGDKQVIRHSTHLGLVENVFFCGGLAEEYGGVIFLEDDMGVSPNLYDYATRALTIYGKDPQIAGVSLYALWFNGYTRQPFVPWVDGSDVFFIQVPYTIGQIWSSAQWKRFREWHSSNSRALLPTDPVHDLFLTFDHADWFPLLTRYVVEMNQFYVYPRMSLATNHGNIGVHFDRTTPFLEAPLLYGERNWSLPTLDQATAVYDTFFEMLPGRLNRLTTALAGLEYDVDLYGTKRPRHLHAEHTLTSRRARRSIRQFGKLLWPHEANVVDQVQGNEILLCKRENLRWDWLAELETRKINNDYATRRQRHSRRAALQFALLDLIKGI